MIGAVRRDHARIYLVNWIGSQGLCSAVGGTTLAAYRSRLEV